MRLQIFADSFRLGLSRDDLSEWRSRWPCSSMKRPVSVEFDKNGLVDINIDMDSHELTAVVMHFAAHRVPKDHPAHFAAIGQFEEGR